MAIFDFFFHFLYTFPYYKLTIVIFTILKFLSINCHNISHNLMCVCVCVCNLYVYFCIQFFDHYYFYFYYYFYYYYYCYYSYSDDNDYCPNFAGLKTISESDVRE